MPSYSGTVNFVGLSERCCFVGTLNQCLLDKWTECRHELNGLSGSFWSTVGQWNYTEGNGRWGRGVVLCNKPIPLSQLEQILFYELFITHRWWCMKCDVIGSSLSNTLHLSLLPASFINRPAGIFLLILIT